MIRNVVLTLVAVLSAGAATICGVSVVTTALAGNIRAAIVFAVAAGCWALWVTVVVERLDPTRGD